MAPAKSSTTKEADDQKWIPSKKDSPLETVVVYESEGSTQCGHVLRLEPLMDYLESSKSQKTMCPICKASPIEFVCDGMVAALQEQSGSDPTSSTTTTTTKSSSNNKLVTFKYRNHLYRLSVMRVSNPTNALSFPFAWCLRMWESMLAIMGENTGVTAQERIAHVLRMDMHSGMRILHKGKILYPNAQQSPPELSAKLIEVCEKGGKPLVIGTRMTEREQTIATAKWFSTFFYNIVKACLTRTLSILQSFLSPLVGLGGRGGGGRPDAIDNHQHGD